MTRIYLRLVAVSTGATMLFAIAGITNGCGPIACTETATCPPGPANVVEVSDGVVEASEDILDASQVMVDASEDVADAREASVEANDAVLHSTSDGSVDGSPQDSPGTDTADALGNRDAARPNDAGAAPDAGVKCGSNALTPQAAISSPMARSPASLAIDGSFVTRWESVHGVDPQWICLDFGAPAFIDRVRILWETACATNYDLQVSNDAAVWTTLQSVVGNTRGGTAPTDWTTAADTPGLAGVGRYLRVNGTVRCTSYGYSIWEMQVFGDTDASCHP